MLVEAAVAVDGSTPVGCTSLGLDGTLQAVADVVHIAARTVVCETVLGTCVLRAENCALENSLKGGYLCSGPLYKAYRKDEGWNSLRDFTGHFEPILGRDTWGMRDAKNSYMAAAMMRLRHFSDQI